MHRCPVCGGYMPTDDIALANHVALGYVVCSAECHSESYRLDRIEPTDLPIPPILGWLNEVKNHVDDP